MASNPSGHGIATAVCRIRMPLLYVGAILLVGGRLAGVDPASDAGFVLVLVGLVLYFRFGRVAAEPVTVEPPVHGTWAAVNSPASKVPSHGMHAYAQTFAIDLVHSPGGSYSPHLGWDVSMSPPTEFSGFGKEVLAPIAGTVVKVKEDARDHRSRDSWPGLVYFFLEGAVRELTGTGRLFGNHVTIRGTDGTYVVLAHLKRDSVRVKAGGEVVAGQQIAACGNSGSSTEPHVHMQVMDRRSPLIAAGLPFEFRDTSGSPVSIPKNGGALGA
mgnify:CR=1 FL=1|jgi:murein DD-endopeptidase MepM/ murein hydrolase activator NlpD